MHNIDISIENLSKIEGHSNLDIKIRNNEVKHVRLKISENKRFYTQAIRGKTFKALPQMVSRICGTCSIAHLLCSIEAIENAIGFVPTNQTSLLRKLSMCGSTIRDHAMHLYLFCLPDIYNKDSIFELDKELMKEAFLVKGAGSNLAKLIAGRAVHATYANVGYFSKIPERNDIKKLVKELKNARSHTLKIIEIFSNCDFDFKSKTNFVSLVSDDFSFLRGEIRSSRGLCIPEIHYWNYLNRIIIPYSQATGFEMEGEEYMVGALSRLNLNKKGLHRETRKDAIKYLKLFPSTNIYHNNLAQAIEILHCIDSSIELLETTDFKKESISNIIPRAGQGVGVVEAPRGTLYYMLSLNSDGRVRYGNLVIPTAQNQINMENDIRELVTQIIDKSKEEITHEIEKLIRAYDPCMSCASHFLKIDWI